MSVSWILQGNIFNLNDRLRHKYFTACRSYLLKIILPKTHMINAKEMQYTIEKIGRVVEWPANPCLAIVIGVTIGFKLKSVELKVPRSRAIS